MIDAVNGMGDLLNWMDPATINKLKRNPFDKTDQNRDGVLDQTETQTFADHLSQKSGKTIDGNELFTQLDTNADGTIDKVEFKDGKETVREMIGSIEKPPPMRGMRPRNDLSSLLINNIDEEDSDSADLYSALQTSSLTNYTDSLNTLLGEDDSELSILA